MLYDIENAAAKLNIPEKSLKIHIRNFLDEFYHNLPELRNVALSADYEKIYFQFHKLKSTLKMISALEATEICQDACDKSNDRLKTDYLSHLERINDSLKFMEINIYQ